jgi:hypothetical protein
VSPIAHLLASWVVAAKTTTNARDCRLVTLAGMVPDADGLGLVVDLVNGVLNRPVKFAYLEYHHFLLHGVVGALAISALAAGLARDRWRVALLSFAVFHLHLLGDLLGSRGPSPQDIWPVFYFGPFSRHLAWTWQGQWALDAWPNRLISVALLGWSLQIAVEQGHSVVGVFHRRADAAVVAVLRKWRSQWLAGWRRRT